MAPAPDLLESAEAAVARIAYLCSDHIISVQPSLKQKTPYSSQLDRLSANSTPGIISGNSESQPEITVVRHNADPFLSAFEPLRSGQLVSILTVSPTLIPAIPHLHKLANYPLTIHVSLIPQSFPDYSDIAAVRQSGFTIIRSDSVQEAQDMAAVAHGVAVKSGRAVIHFFEADNSRDDPVPLEDRRVLDRMLDRAAARSYQSSTIDASNIYAADGVQAQTRVIPLSNGVNGTSNGVKSPPQSPTATNGFSNGDSASSNLSRTDSVTSESEVAYRPVNSADVYKYLTAGFEIVRQVTGRSYRPFEYYGPTYAENAIFLFGSKAKSIATTIASAASTEDYAKTGVIVARVYRPWTGQKFLDVVPKTVKKVAVLEQIKKRTTKWGPLFLDLLSTIRGGDAETKRDLALVGYQLGYVSPSTLKLALRGVLQNLKLDKPIQNLDVGLPEGPAKSAAGYELSRPATENAYFKVLNQLFGERLHVANALENSTAGISASIATSPEYGFGSLLARLEKKDKFQQKVADAAKSTAFTTSVPNDWLAKWLIAANDTKKRPQIADELITHLKTDGSELSSELLNDQALFYKESSWLVGSDAWAYDLGNSGVHHVIASGKNINMLVIDSQPYSEKAVHDATRRKKDIGLYAMNFGGCYVASVAVYSSYTQVLHALIEAEQFDGPSVVLAYLPYQKEDESPLTILQETKKAVDIGYWPLYRWDPTREEKGKGDNFELDSERIRNEMKEFLERENHLSRLLKRDPVFAANLKGSYGVEVRDAQKRKAKDAYAKLLEGLQGAPLTILFASDGGNAENLAKRLQRRGKARGLKAYAMSMDDYPLEDINSEENLVLMTSVAGQGEFPQNGRNFWEAVKGGATDIDLAGVNYAVFGLGDSHYWPRKEDKIYYNKPAKDLDARLEVLGGKRIVDVGLGDDQDPDTYQTAYADWEPKLWTALGVDKVEGLADEPPPITNEDIKIASNFLRGTIAEGLEDMSTMAISAADQQLTKFHGTYMQDDRDLREERKAQGLEPAYSFMIRCRLPGGIATPKQWLQMDDICEDYGNKTMKLTTRQTFQFHGIIKTDLRNSMKAINRALMTTIAACGDVNRNVMCSSLPYKSAYHRQVWEYSKLISDHLLPSTTAYHEIWLQDENDKKTQVAGDAVVDHEPLYGPTYLPRKFKITIAIPPHNDTDVYAHDIGLIAIKGEDGNLAGFNFLAGGGMGVTHNNKKTYPRTGSMFGYVPKETVHLACEKVMLVQRDHGDRKNRKHARLKYTIDDMGVEGFRGKVEELLGWKFEPEKPFTFQSNVDTFGWQKDENGRNHFTFFIENGRIEDTPEFMMRTGLREIAKLGKGEFRLTGNQHLIMSNVEDEDLAEVKGLMEHCGLDNVKFSGLRLSSSACVAFPTCGLAMAESERYLPKLISKLESTLEEAGLRHDSIVMRMTGCPNGCARPWLAEVAFVGKAYGAYNMYLGGGYHGQRLNKLYRSSIKEEEILDILKPMFKRYAIEREEGEKFGDFCIRSGIIKETTHGTNFHEGVAEEDTEE